MKTLFIIAGLLVGSPRDECIDCGWERQRATLCRPHAKLEKSLLTKAKKAWKKAAAAERVDLLRDVGDLTRTHEGKPSEKVAEFLAGGLREPASAVFEQAVQSLLAGQHPEVVVESLVDALDDMEKECDKAIKSMRKEEFSMVFSTILPRTENTLLALGQLPDERSWKAIEGYLSRPLLNTPGRLLLVASEAGIALGSSRSMQGVADFVVELDRAVKKKKTGPTFEAPRQMTLASAMTLLFIGAHGDDVDRIGARLAEEARKKGLTPPEEVSDWGRWMEEHSSSWGDELGTLDSPTMAALPEAPPERKGPLKDLQKSSR